MDIQRSLTILGIAVVSYMMILAWQEDYGKATSTPSSQTVETSSDSLPALEASTKPSQVEDVPVSVDIPQTVNNEAVPDDAVEQMNPARKSLITVKTDVFNLVINRDGGDIQRLELPQYPVSAENPEQPFVLMEDDSVRTYVAQTGIVGPNGTDSSDGRPIWQADKEEYILGKGKNELNVDLFYRQANGTEITRRYTFEKGSYLVRVSHIVRNKSDQPWKGALFGQIKRDGSDDPGTSTAGFAPMPTFLGGAYWSEEQPYNKISFDDMQDEPVKLSHQGGWVAMIQHYFLSAWIPAPDQKHTYSTVYRSSSNEYLLRFVSPLVTVEPGQEDALYAEFYAGPKIQDKLEVIHPGLNMTVDYGWLWFISQPIFAFLVFLQSGKLSVFGMDVDLGAGVGNWGIAIILLTLTIKALFFKLSASSYRSMAKMRKVAPEMQRLREQHKNDRQKQSMELMKLYQKEKINPLGGCLPILVQMPVFIALYYVLLESVELRQAPFFGWIQDLSIMDPYFILPLLMGASMFLQTRLNPTPPDPTQAQVMKWMPVIFTVFFLWFPAGLVLYWLTNNVLSIAQQWVITRKIESE